MDHRDNDQEQVDLEVFHPRSIRSNRQAVLKQMATEIFYLDLCIAQAITDNFPQEERPRQIRRHFARLWKTPPSLDVLLEWLDDSLHDAEMSSLRGFSTYISALSREQLTSAIANEDANDFYFRLVEERMTQLTKTTPSLQIWPRGNPSTIPWSPFRSRKDPRLIHEQVTSILRSQALDQQILEAARLRANTTQTLYETQDIHTPHPTPTSPGAGTLATIAFCFSLLALYPAWLAAQKTPAARGSGRDAGFCGLLSATVLQLLALGVEILGPLLWPRVFWHVAVRSRRLVLGLGGLVLVCMCASLVVYVAGSARWGGMVAFAAQAMMGFVQLLLVFGT